MRIVLICLVFLLANAQDSLANELSPKLDALVTSKDRVANDFSEVIKKCVGRVDTNHILFHGCIDWHSSVHGNWALFALSNAGLGPQRRFSLEAFDAEMAFLMTRPKFEFPYGRAWLLRLAIEGDQAWTDAAFARRTDLIFDDMLTYYTTQDFKPFSTSYGSSTWALINLFDYAEHFNKTQALERITTIIRRVYISRGKPECDYQLASGSFMAVCTNWAMLAGRVLGPEAYDQWVSDFVKINGLPRPIKHPKGAHEYGLNFSRAWGLWDMYERAPTKRPDIAEAYADLVLTTYQDSEKWDGDYRVSAHWVPQFGMFAIQPLFSNQM